MKRWITLLLALLMAAALAVPALAETEQPLPEIDTGMMDLEDTVSFAMPEEEGDMQALLEKVTLAVKETLDVGDEYTDFSGDYIDGLHPRWSLRWSMEGRDLSVETDTAGKILTVNRWLDSGVSDRFYGFDPAFPAIERKQAEKQAEDWCARLFTGEETAQVQGVRTYLGTDGYYTFSGIVRKNGLPSPVQFTLSIDGEGMRSFYRSDSYGGYVGELPGPEAETAQADAAKALADAVEMELYYVSDGEGGAALRYVPVGPYTVVDAGSGEAVDMDALYEAVGGDRGEYNTAAMDAAAEAPEPAGGEAGLTEAELASIANYGDVLDQAAIEKALGKIKALGLEGFALTRCSYALDSESGDVTATVRYTAPMTEDALFGYDADAFAQAQEQGRDMTVYKNITLDGKTGELKSVYTQYPLWERDETMTMSSENRRRAADNFLKNAAPALAAEAAVCTLKGYNEGEQVVYARTHDGYFFPENTLSVTVNPATGAVDGFTVVWDEDVTFGASKKPVGEKAALEAYTGALKVALGYVAWPLDVTREENAVYADSLEWGYRYVEELRLGYYYEDVAAVAGVDALTGEAVKRAPEDGTFLYDDLDGENRAEMIQALGLAGVGFDGGAFRPDEPLCWRDGVILALRAGGRYVDEGDDETLLEQGRRQKFMPAGPWDPEQAMTRMDFLRMILGASRYGDAAALKDVWDAGFEDVDGGDEGYAAIARALGLADGKTLEPEGELTRADGAELLYRFMDR